ncbi:hypothetical protein ACOSQ3_018196 [Xanthoceras sorbifolium]
MKNILYKTLTTSLLEQISPLQSLITLSASDSTTKSYKSSSAAKRRPSKTALAFAISTSTKPSKHLATATTATPLESQTTAAILYLALFKSKAASTFNLKPEAGGLQH